MDYSRFLNPVQDGDLTYMLRKIHVAATKCEDGISMASGTPLDSCFPFESASFKLTDGEEIEVDKETMKNIQPYQEADGLDELRQWIKHIHQRYHRPPLLDDADKCKRFDSCVTSGCMGAMHLLFSQVIKQNEVVLVDEFTFGGTICCLKRAGAKMVGVKMDNKGIIPSALKHALDNWKQLATDHGAKREDDIKAPKLLCTVPTGQNPTGVTVPLNRKQEIYKIAREHDLLILEDDPYYYLQFAEALEPSYQSIDTDGRVIRLDSVSKLLCPGIRVGWVTGPAAIVNRVADAQSTDTMNVSSFGQVAVLKFLEHLGMDGFQKRITDLQKVYKGLRDETLRAAEKYLTDHAEWYTPHAGVFFWMKMKHLDDSIFLADTELSKKHRVFAVPSVDFSCNQETGPYLRIAYSSTNRIEEGIARLAGLLKEVTAQRSTT